MPDINDMSSVASKSEGSINTNSIDSLDYSGIYRAKCIDNKDPLKTGRIKVFIPKVHRTKVEETEGTWAYPCTPYAGSNLEPDAKEPIHDFGSLYVPPIDSFVYVFFEDGDQSKVRYFGGLITQGAIPTENQAGDQYWDKHTVIKTPKKRLIFVSDDNTNDACILIRGMQR